MSPFDYLSVLISIVLGLGVTQVLAGFAGLVRTRKRIRMYWPVPVQMAVVFLISVQIWWALFGLRGMRVWTFESFLVVLMQPVSVYLMAALITPDLDEPGAINLRETYFRECRWFFGSILFALAISFAKNFVTNGGPPEGLDLLGHIVFGVIALTGLISRSNVIHKIIAAASLLAYSGYIALLFVRLPH
ncbi:MAG TPA: hypothetical protein VLV55_01925 [Rhizomicrobium sp.]|nr:hypothetical protein [Rhizomicrobium sp.]